MLKRYYAILLFLFGSLTSWSQIGIGPITNNQELARASYLEQQLLSQEVAALTGRPMQFPEQTILRAPCPTFDEGTRYLFPGEDEKIIIDTSGLGGGSGASFSLVTCDPIDAGTVTIVEDTLFYISDPGINAGVDTLCIEFCPVEGDCFLLTYPIVVKRPGTTYNLPETQLIAGEFLMEYCVDETLLPGEIACNRLIDCGDTYDGDGEQIVYFDTYNQPTSCIRYQASQFGGVDEVCVVLCDEFTVCDTFVIPFRINSETLDLPFFDDFSYAGPYPHIENWLDRDVFVNNTMSTKLPSVGMATFDGLDKRGATYNTEFGIADQLTSRYIDLTNTSGDIFLKFYLAPKGLGLYPNLTDTIFVEFRDQFGDWKQVAAYPGIDMQIPIDSVPDFEFRAIQVANTDFIHDAFQFRFSNLVSPSGLFDLWHLDYVYLNDSEDNSPDFNDVAFSAIPSRMLANYSSMPWWHFESFVEEEFAGMQYESSFFNHFDQTVSITESAITLMEETTDFPFFGSENVVDGVDANIPSKDPTNRTKTIDQAIRDGYVDDLEAQFPGAQYVKLALHYDLTLGSQNPLYERNDSVTAYTVFDNYFAYDDGSAESYLFLENPQGVNPSLAIKYRTNIDDTLRAVQFHFPHVNGNVSNQLFNMSVYVGDLDTEPVFNTIFINPVYPDTKFDTLQGFTTYRLQNILGELAPVFLPADTDFYIEFQQATVINNGIPIGFDLNNEEQQHVEVNLGNGWDPLTELAPTFKGALMIRPVVGDFTPPNTPVKEVNLGEVLQVNIHPNPSTGIINVSGLDNPNDWNYRLLDNTGRLLASGQAAPSLELNNLLNGWYIIQFYHPENGKFASKKLMILK